MEKYNWSDLKPLSLNDEDLVQVNWVKYYKEAHPKNQVVLHHTVSGPGITGDLNTWKNYDSHIAVCMIIDRDGTMNQLFSSRYWGWHLGTGIKKLDQCSIAVELDNWGQLEEKNGDLYTVYNTKVDVPTVHYPKGFRGEQLFEAYPTAQITALGELLLLWHNTYGISLEYNDSMWDVSEHALDGADGIWAHVSFRPSGKWDVHPDPQLISMLKSLKGLV